MNTKQHPLSVQASSVQEDYRVDILFGGSETEVLTESAKLTHDLLSIDEETKVLYINTLVSNTAFEPYGRKCVRDLRKQDRLSVITLLGGQSLAYKLDFLRTTIERRGIRYVILNSFEFGAMSHRERTEIFFWIKALRDHSRTSVIVFTQSGPRRYGTLGQMRFIATSCEEVGAYCRTREEERKAALAEEKKVEKKEPSPLDNIKRDANGQPKYSYDRQRIKWAEEAEARKREEAEILRKQSADDATPENEPLKTNDLQPQNAKHLALAA